MYELEDSLIKRNENIAGIDEFEAVYNQKKMINKALEYERRLKK